MLPPEEEGPRVEPSVSRDETVPVMYAKEYSRVVPSLLRTSCSLALC